MILLTGVNNAGQSLPVAMPRGSDSGQRLARRVPGEPSQRAGEYSSQCQISVSHMMAATGCTMLQSIDRMSNARWTRLAVRVSARNKTSQT